MFLWRAESQANGNIHFHLITNRFIWWPELRSMWNFHQERLGYVSRYRRGMQAYHDGGFHYNPQDQAGRSQAIQYKAYITGIKTDWDSPNSTDVHALCYVSRVQAYVTKYVSKEESNRPIEGHLWGCSRNLSGLTGAQVAAVGTIADEIDDLFSDPHVWHFTGQYFTAIRFDPAILTPDRFPGLCAVFREYLELKFPEYLQPQLKLTA
jgi:hypothetical protein